MRLLLNKEMNHSKPIIPINGNGRAKAPPPVLVMAIEGAVAGADRAIVSADISYAASLTLISSLGTQPRGLFLPVASAQTQPGSPSNSKTAVAFL